VVFTLVGMFCGLGKLYAIATQINTPWEMNAHASVSSIVASTTIINTEAISATCFLLQSIFIWKRTSYSQYCLYASIILSVSSLAYWQFMWNPYIWVLMWFAGGNVLFALACFYIDKIISISEEKVLKLHDSTYQFKKV